MLFRWEAPCDVRRWQDELDRMAVGGLSWLKLVWLAGDNWTPAHHVQRWAIYQMVPLSRAPLGIAHELARGPNPRLYGYWDRVEQEFVRLRNFGINREQWVLHKDTGCWGKLYWVVQGSPGGHRRRWDDHEARLSQLLGGEDQPPPPGELPYQPMSFAVIDRLREHDLLLRYRKNTDFTDAKRLDLEERQREREFRKQLHDIQTDQIMDTLRFTHAEIGQIRDQWRRIGKSYNGRPSAADVVDIEQIKHELIEG